MKLGRGLFSPAGAAAFFLFSWVVQLLFNSIVVGHFGLLAPLSYWQAASLLFLFMMLFAWSGGGLAHTWWGFFEWENLFGLEVGLFFLFAWAFQMIFNRLVVAYFGLLAPITYWQAAGLLFLAAILTFWTGFLSPRRPRAIEPSQIGRRIKEEIKRFFEEW